MCTDDFEEGDEYTIEVEFESNPEPQKVWSYQYIKNCRCNSLDVFTNVIYSFLLFKLLIQIEWEMRRKNRKQKKVVVQAGKSKSGFEAEDEEEDVSKILTLGKYALIQISYVNLLMVAEWDWG